MELWSRQASTASCAEPADLLSGRHCWWVRRRFIGAGHEINMHSLRNGFRAYFPALTQEPNQTTLSQLLQRAGNVWLRTTGKGHQLGHVRTVFAP